jgi:uncharacterized damage-inducible protein DinB
MYRTIEDFIIHFRLEANLTEQIFETLTDESLNQAPCGYDRSLGRLAWHITSTIAEMMRTAGFPFDAATEDQQIPTTVLELVDAYRNSCDLFVQTLQQRWNDSELDDPIPMYGDRWRRRDLLIYLMSHQAHHRGQMTVLMRQLDLKVHGIYGPSKEEWAELGMVSPQ